MNELTPETLEKLQERLSVMLRERIAAEEVRGIFCDRNYRADVEVCGESNWNSEAAKRVFQPHTNKPGCWCARPPAKMRPSEAEVE